GVRRADDLRELVGPTGVPDQAVDSGGHFVGSAAERRELRLTRLHHFGDAIKHLSAVVSSHPRPTSTRLTRDADGVAQILPRCARDVRTQSEVGAPGLGAWERSAYEELVGLLDREAFGHASSSTTYGSSPCRPPSRPKPDSLLPPNGAAGSKRLDVFAQTTPARRR